MAPRTLEKGDFDLTEDRKKRLTAGAATDPPLGRGLALHCGILATASHDREEGVSALAIDPLAPLVLLLRLDR